jgi:SLOG cluster2
VRVFPLRLADSGALNGTTLDGILAGISDSAHFRLALGEIARALLLGGGLLAYGGHLKPEGYTPFLVHEIERWNRHDQPLLVCLAWSVHRGTALSALERFERDLRLLGRMVCLDPDGAEVDRAAGRGEAPVPIEDLASSDGLSPACVDTCAAHQRTSAAGWQTERLPR